MRRSLAAVLVLGLAVASGACGNEGGGVATGSTDEFCTDWIRADEALSELDGQTASDFERIRAALAEIVYPSDLKSDAEVMLAGLDRVIDVARDHDDDLANLTPKQQKELLDELESSAQSSERVEAFADDNCAGYDSDDLEDFDYMCSDIEEEGPCGPDGEPLDE